MGYLGACNGTRSSGLWKTYYLVRIAETCRKLELKKLSDSPGKIIFINGASSSGKSTLAQALQSALPVPFWHVSIDHLIAARILPPSRPEVAEFEWNEIRPHFFDGFRRCLPALAEAGNNLIVEHIIETDQWCAHLQELLRPFDVFMIGLHCPIEELERREIERGDRRVGSARQDFLTIHKLCVYDLELSSINPLEANVQAVLEAWVQRQKRSRWFRD